MAPSPRARPSRKPLALRLQQLLGCARLGRRPFAAEGCSRAPERRAVGWAGSIRRIVR